jgi:hypothetical protein
MVIATLWSGPVGAQDLASAKAFMHGLFAPDSQAASLDGMARVRDVATPTLAALSEAVDAHELDFDPMCLCQESENLKVVGISVQADGPARAKARIALLSDRVYARQFQLILIGGGWRIDNIAAGDSNLREILGDKIAP